MQIHIDYIDSDTENIDSQYKTLIEILESEKISAKPR